MTSSCNASLGRSPSPREKHVPLVSIPRCWPWTYTGYKRRLATISNPGYTDPNWASRLTRLKASLFSTIRVSLLSIRSRCQSIFYHHRSKPTKQQLPRTPPDLPFLRGSFELLVHDDATWGFFFSKSLSRAKEDLDRMQRTWLPVGCANSTGALHTDQCYYKVDSGCA